MEKLNGLFEMMLLSYLEFCHLQFEDFNFAIEILALNHLFEMKILIFVQLVIMQMMSLSMEK